MKMRTFEQFDGSEWRQYESDRAIILLTGTGRKLVAGQNIGRLLRHYADDYHHGREADTDTRRFMAEGGSARIFSLGDTSLAVKEKRLLGDDLFASLYRMDRLIDAVDNYDPGKNAAYDPSWIGVPQHYGIIAMKEDTRKQFMLMQKIDNGVTVGDVLGYHHEPREQHLKESIDNLYGGVTDEFQEEIAGRYGMTLGILRKALMAKYLSPDEYIPDIDQNPYNIVLEPLETPVGGSNIKFWIIDQ